MTVYRYKAVPLEGGGTQTAGELAADSPASLRASLRRVGLQVIEARPARRVWAAPAALDSLVGPARDLLHGHLRARRVRAKAELWDSLATLLGAGLPLVEAVSTVGGSRSAAGARAMLAGVREGLGGGRPLDGCMADHPGWFDCAEVAMVRAARESGELARVLRSLAERHERAGALAAKLVAALTYPALVSCVGVGVVVFLGVKTLPDLVAILGDAGIEPPGLTVAIMSLGQALARFGVVLVVGVVATGVGLVVTAGRLRRAGWAGPRWLRRLVPRAVRQTVEARAWSGLSQLVGAGVPLVEALRVGAPSVDGLVGGSLAASLRDAADRIERGSSLAGSLGDPVWFDDACRRLIEVGEGAGELPAVLSRLADRTRRSAERSIDRFAALLEPLVILALASAVGVVVIGALLPILRLQEVIG